jgi:hypothetical protein
MMILGTVVSVEAGEAGKLHRTEGILKIGMIDNILRIIKIHPNVSTIVIASWIRAK